MGPNLMASVMRDRRYRGDSHVKLEAETVGCCHELSNTRSLEAGRGEKGFLPKTFRGSNALPIPFLDFQNFERIDF